MGSSWMNFCWTNFWRCIWDLEISRRYREIPMSKICSKGIATASAKTHILSSIKVAVLKSVSPWVVSTWGICRYSERERAARSIANTYAFNWEGPRLYTRNGFAVCTSLFLQLCILCAPCVQVVLYRSLAVVLQVKSYSSWFCSTW